MKRKIDVDELCLAYNEAREENKGKEGSPAWAFKVLKEKGISTNLAKRILAEPTLVIHSRRENAGKGNYRACTFPFTPVHRDRIENWLYPPKKSNNVSSKERDEDFEGECVSYLKSNGYEIKKCLGFDEESFSKDHPDLYKQYLKYEII